MLKRKIFILLMPLLLIPFSLQALPSLNCETTNPDNTVTLDEFGNPVDRDFYAVADCRIEMAEGSTFEVLSGDHAQFTAEQRILLRPGFHARAGSTFRARIRDCIRNPNFGEVYAAWGAEGDNGWMDVVAEGFVTNFSNDPDLTVSEKFDTWIGTTRDFYVDRATAGGADDIDVGSEHGIDEGMVFFNVAHGSPGGFEVRDYDASGNPIYLRIDAANQNMRLGNATASPDTSEQGELRYFQICSCRTFSHGPGVVPTPVKSEEYDRPSEFVSGTTDSAAHRNLFERWGPVLTENIRMMCGVSTRATCQGSWDTEMVDRLWNEYSLGETVADSWGQAFSGKKKGEYWDGGTFVRDIITTPICIAIGNNDSGNLKSPITEDLRYTNKANPYDGAMHIVSWETVNGVLVVREQPTAEAMPATLPAFQVSSQPADPAYSGTDLAYDGAMLVSREVNDDGIPKTRIDPKTGKIRLAGNRQKLTAGMAGKEWSDTQYLDAAKQMIENLGWNETDIGRVDTLKSVLQVFPYEHKNEEMQVIKLLKDITFTFKREISIGKSSVDVQGEDNRIIIRLNPDGTMKRASKSWKRIGEQVENLPVKSYSLAYAEALNKMDDADFYTLSSWNWGYQAALVNNNREMMLMHYYFRFKPVEDRLNQPYEEIEVTVLGHDI